LFTALILVADGDPKNRTAAQGGLSRHLHGADIAAGSCFRARHRRHHFAELLHNNSHFMAHPEHLAILKKGVSEWNTWRLENLDIDPNLNGADLEGVDLESNPCEPQRSGPLHG
jgi:hypothetical protein